MPIIKSAKKRVRQAAKNRSRNIATKHAFRSEIKKLMAHIEKKDAKKAAESLSKVQSELDKAVKKNILKKNTAARKKAQLAAKVKALGAKPATVAKKPTAKTTAKTTVKKTPAKTATKPAAKKTAAKPATKKAPAKK